MLTVMLRPLELREIKHLPHVMQLVGEIKTGTGCLDSTVHFVIFRNSKWFFEIGVQGSGVEGDRW